MQRVFSLPPAPENYLLESCQELENKIRRLAKMARIAEGVRGERTFDVLASARKIGMTRDEVQAIAELQKLRDKVALMDDLDLSEQDAQRFRDVIRGLLGRLEIIEEEAIDREMAKAPNYRPQDKRK
jgi:hypothetical protein